MFRWILFSHYALKYRAIGLSFSPPSLAIRLGLHFLFLICEWRKHCEGVGDARGQIVYLNEVQMHMHEYILCSHCKMSRDRRVGVGGSDGNAAFFWCSAIERKWCEQNCGLNTAQPSQQTNQTHFIK